MCVLLLVTVPGGTVYSIQFKPVYLAPVACDWSAHVALALSTQNGSSALCVCADGESREWKEKKSFCYWFFSKRREKQICFFRTV